MPLIWKVQAGMVTACNQVMSHNKAAPSVFLADKKQVLQAGEVIPSPTELAGALLERQGFVRRHWQHFQELLDLSDQWLSLSSKEENQKVLTTRSRLDRQVQLGTLSMVPPGQGPHVAGSCSIFFCAWGGCLAEPDERPASLIICLSYHQPIRPNHRAWWLQAQAHAITCEGEPASSLPLSQRLGKAPKVPFCLCFSLKAGLIYVCR